MTTDNLCHFCNKKLPHPQDLVTVTMTPMDFVWLWIYCKHTIKANYKSKDGTYKDLEFYACNKSICYYCMKERGEYCRNHLGNMVQPWCEE